jgi:hypothetical protein
MFCKDSILDSKNVCRDPIHRLAEPRKSPVHDHKILFGYNCSRFVLQRRGNALSEFEQTLTTRGDVSAVLNAVRGPVSLGRYVVPFVEESVKSLKNECLVLFLFSPVH